MKPERAVALWFLVSMVASIGLVVVYVLGDQPQLEGTLLGLALGGLGLGIVVWARDLLHEPEQVEQRESLVPTADEREGAQDALETEQFTRRSLLVALGSGAALTLSGALAIPALSLGPRPGQDLKRTAWSAGARLVDENGDFIRPEDVGADSVTTVYPNGAIGSADSQALLVRVEPSMLALPEGRAEWAPDGCLVYSKICTHAGCPVGLYRAEAHQLLCPCHQSTFDVLRGAPPVFGPAARPLPQLPLDVDNDGFLVARSDFPESVGPSFWNMDEGDDG